MAPGPPPKHGTRKRREKGCTCDECVVGGPANRRAAYRRQRAATEAQRTAPVSEAPPVLLEPVGVRQIAERLGVSVRTVSTWVTRGVLPSPDWRPSVRHSVWEWPTVVQWAADTGRAPGQRRPDLATCGLCGQVMPRHRLADHEDACPIR